MNNHNKLQDREVSQASREVGERFGMVFLLHHFKAAGEFHANSSMRY